MSHTTIAPEVLALLWALKIDITGLAEMPLIEAHEAVRERVENVLNEESTHVACQAIAHLLNGKVLTGLLGDIATILRASGYQIDAPSDGTSVLMMSVPIPVCRKPRTCL